MSTYFQGTYKKQDNPPQLITFGTQMDVILTLITIVKGEYSSNTGDGNIPNVSIKDKVHKFVKIGLEL